MKKYFLTIFILFITFLTYADLSSDTSNDKSYRKTASIIDIDYVPSDKLKSPPVLFDGGLLINTKSRILMKYDGTNYYFKYSLSNYTLEAVPNNKWFFDLGASLWGQMTFSEGNFLHLGFSGLFNFKQNVIVPTFNLDDLYVSCKYPLGKVIIGRSFTSLKSAFIFSGPLDAIELTINVPYLNFKSFVGYTGLLGFFHPSYNPYRISSYDNSYVDQSNLINSVYVLQFNQPQSRRIFFSTDFDIYFFGQHVNPFFLLQYDLSQISGNTGHTINTFHLGLNLEGRIFTNLYYNLTLVGMFGTNQIVGATTAMPIIACAFLSGLRYTIPVLANSTFFLNYSLGTGNDDNSDFSNDSFGYSKPNINKFYYYGKFDGGYVLTPILSNIHSISFKYQISPELNTKSFSMSLYISAYQTFKLWSAGSISDPDAVNDSYIVGSEFDLGVIFNITKNFNLNLDGGIFIPLYAYQNNIPRFKLGFNCSYKI